MLELLRRIFRKSPKKIKNENYDVESMRYIIKKSRESRNKTTKENKEKTINKTQKNNMSTIIIDPLKIIIVGVGGGGNSVITRINEIGIDNIHAIAIDTDAKDLYHCQANEKILIGEKTCRGRDTRGDSDLGKKCGEENEELIYEKLESADMVFILCGLGGGTGTGAAPIISKIAKKIGALTVAIVSMPFYAEGFKRRENAEKGLEQLQDNVDKVIVIPNDKLLEIAPTLTMHKAFLFLDPIICLVVKSITDLIAKEGLFSSIFEDIRNVFQTPGIGMIGLGESDPEDNVLESANVALNSPLLDLDVSDADAALINISTSPDIKLEEYEKIVQTIADKLNSEAYIKWGLQIDDSLENRIRTTLIVVGKTREKYPNDLPFENWITYLGL